MVTCDFHTHILPGMDDGAQSEEVALEMLSRMQNQKVDIVCLTPHYFHHRETVDHFIERRQESFNKLTRAIQDNDLEDRVPKLCLGAEIQLETELLNEEKLTKLCYEGTNSLLLEFPFRPLDYRTYETIENITYRFGVKAVIAHLDRYEGVFTKNDMSRILELPNSIIQLSTESVKTKQGRKKALKLLDCEIPVVLGSDTHNLEKRPPDTCEGYSAMEEKMKNNQRHFFYQSIEEVLA